MRTTNRTRRLMTVAGASLAIALTPASAALAGPGADTEVQWAQGQQSTNPGNPTYRNGCLAFVGDAANTAGIDFRSQIDVPIGYDTYPDDLLGHFTGGTFSTEGEPPAGAWVFWSSSYGRESSHVALSTGGGQLISTNDSANDSGIHTESMGDHAGAQYQGWWLPAGA